MSDLEQLARRFPLIPRPRPPQPPFPQQLTAIAELASTPPDHPNAAARIAAAHNQAALIASNCGYPELARTLCWQHHHRYTHHRPWTATEARLALEPLVNLARLHIRAGHPDLAIHHLQSLLNAVTSASTAEIDSQPIDLGNTIASRHDRSHTRRWLWSVTLAEGIRALTRAGRWDDALAHARRHRGIGDTLLDGRQVAIIATVLRGDHAEAKRLLAATSCSEPWQNPVAVLLDLMIRRSTNPRMVKNYAVTPKFPELPNGLDRITAVEIGLATVLLVGRRIRPVIAARLNELAATVDDASVARSILGHPAQRYLPLRTRDRLAELRDGATSSDSAELIQMALGRCLRDRCLNNYQHCAR